MLLAYYVLLVAMKNLDRPNKLTGGVLPSFAAKRRNGQQHRKSLLLLIQLLVAAAVVLLLLCGMYNKTVTSGETVVILQYETKQEQTTFLVVMIGPDQVVVPLLYHAYRTPRLSQQHWQAASARYENVVRTIATALSAAAACMLLVEEILRDSANVATAPCCNTHVNRCARTGVSNQLHTAQYSAPYYI